MEFELEQQLLSHKEFYAKYEYNLATPMMQQYLDIKFKHQNCLVLFRLGDFYELFFDDAKIASQILNIALTRRGKCNDIEIAMCGIPYHALDNYLNKLIVHGYKIAICAQEETPEQAKKRGGHKAVVNRSVSRIITSGTIVEEALIETSRPNYLISVVIYEDNTNCSICYLDLAIAEINVIDVPIANLVSELVRLRPKELLIAEKHRGSEYFKNSDLQSVITYNVDSLFATSRCSKIISEFYKINSLKSIGEISNSQISAIGSVLEYLLLTQKSSLPTLPLPKIISFLKFMHIDASTRKNLELTQSLNGQRKGSLIHAIDFTVTKIGSRLLYLLLSAPLNDHIEINRRLRITEFFVNNPLIINNIRLLLNETADLDRCLTRNSMNRSTPKDLLSIKNTLEIALQIKNEFLVNCGINLPKELEDIVMPLSGEESVINLIEQTIKEDALNNMTDGGFIKLDYDFKLQELSDLLNNNHLHLEKLKHKYQEETDIDSLKISNNNMLGLFIEVNARYSNQINDNKFIHRQTIANAARYTTKELQQLESDITNAKILANNIEQKIFSEVCELINDKFKILKQLAESLSWLDVYCNFAYLAINYNYTKPVVTNNTTFHIYHGRHSVIEPALTKSHKIFVTNDCLLNQDERIWLITGPNMAGKSTFLRQNALIAILAQIGSYVPAQSAEIGVIDRVFSRVGAGDNLFAGESTSMVEMLETSAILAQATNKSMIILDEVGRGTATHDGMAIAWGILEYIHDKIKSKCLFATHYHELSQVCDIMLAIKNYTVDIEETDEHLTFLHKIIPGIAKKSYGIHAAALAGLPQSVIEKAKNVLAKLEKDSIKTHKYIMKKESNNLNIFDSADKIDIKETKSREILAMIESIDPNSLSPIDALSTIFKLKEQIKT